MTTMYVGADPGINGAIAILNDDGILIDAFDVPKMKYFKKFIIDSWKLIKIISQYRNSLEADRVVFTVERVHAMPRQGVTSSFNFGMVYGQLLSIANTMDYELYFIGPAQWKKQFKLTGLGKDFARQLVIELVTEEQKPLFKRKKDTDRADATLIGLWGYQFDKKTVQASGTN